VRLDLGSFIIAGGVERYLLPTIVKLAFRDTKSRFSVESLVPWGPAPAWGKLVGSKPDTVALVRHVVRPLIHARIVR
jgi:hypothetical protein